jgi:hypothetical protein
MGGDNVNGVLASTDPGSDPAPGGASWSMGATDVDHALAGSGNISALDNSSGDHDHDGIPDFADTNDVSGF